MPRFFVARGAGARPAASLEPVATLVIALAAALRLWHLAWGLPGVYEEALPVHVALGMLPAAGGAPDLNPHFFNYPSLGIYLHLAVQWATMQAGMLAGAWSGPADYRLAFTLEPTPMLLAARGLSVAADVLAVAAAIRLGERVARGAGIVAGAILALAPLAIVTSRSVFVDTLMAAFALASLERAVAWRTSGGAGTLAAAGLLAGLAAGCKYPAAVLLAPIAWLAWRREGSRGIAHAAGAALLAAAAFLATTPWVVLDGAAFARDFSFEGAHAAAGHLGSVGRRALAYHAANLWRNLGPAVLLAAAAAPLLAGLRRGADDSRGPMLATDAAIACLLAVAGFGFPIALARIEADRYLLPVLGPAAVLAGIGAAGALRVAPLQRPGWTVAAVALLAWPLAGGVAAARSGASHTQTLAREFLEQSAAPGTLVVTEGYGPLLPTEARLDAARGGAVYRHASAPWRARFDAVRPWNVVSIPLGVSGAVTNTVTPPGGRPVVLEVAAHGSAFNEAFYEPALYAEADLFVTTRAVRARHESDPARFPRAAAFYRLLDREAPVVARFRPDSTTLGSEIVIHRLDARARRAIAATGALDLAWWTTAVPEAYRREATARLAAAETASLAPVRPDGAPSAWMGSLRPLYHARIASFALEMASAHARAGRDLAAARLAGANLLVAPDDVPACRVAAAALRRLGRAAEARRVLERAFAASGPEVDTELALEYARTLSRLGERARARAILLELAKTLPADDPIGGEARAEAARSAKP